MTTLPACSLESLREKLAQWEGAFRGSGRGESAISSGCGPLDRLLPAGGLLPGTLVEWLAAGDGSGAGTLAALAAREACCDGGWLVLVDRRREWYPPALLRWGIARETLLVVHPRAGPEAAWALDQSLRCPAVGAVLAWIDTLEGKTFRRWQLAAEQSGVLGLLLRPDAARHEPSWADVRLAVEPVAFEPAAAELRRLRIHVVRCRNGAGGAQVDVEIDDETHRVRVASQLAAPEIRPGRAEAS